MTCSQLEKAIVADGAKKITRQQAMNGQPPKGQYIAMMLRPITSCNFARCQPDFHFLRKDSNGLWSQKAGEAPATNRDAQNQLIKDPQAAKLQGSYTDFCVSINAEAAVRCVSAQILLGISVVVHCALLSAAKSGSGLAALLTSDWMLLGPCQLCNF